MERTEALDKNWAGMYFCLTCEFYTGQLILHDDHMVTYIPKCEHETERTYRVAWYVGQ